MINKIRFDAGDNVEMYHNHNLTIS